MDGFNNQLQGVKQNAAGPDEVTGPVGPGQYRYHVAHPGHCISADLSLEASSPDYLGERIDSVMENVPGYILTRPVFAEHLCAPGIHVWHFDVEDTVRRQSVRQARH